MRPQQRGFLEGSLPAGLTKLIFIIGIGYDSCEHDHKLLLDLGVDIVVIRYHLLPYLEYGLGTYKYFIHHFFTLNVYPIIIFSYF